MNPLRHCKVPRSLACCCALVVATFCACCAGPLPAEEIYGPPYLGYGGRWSSRVEEVKKLADEADMVFIGVTDLPRIVALEIDEVPEQFESKGRFLEAQVRVVSRFKTKKDHLFQVDEMKLKYQARSLRFGEQYLFFIREAKDDEGRRFYEVTHAAYLTESQCFLFGYGHPDVEIRVMRRVLHIWGHTEPEEDFASVFTALLEGNPQQVILTPFLPVSSARPVWLQAMARRSFNQSEEVWRFAIVAHDVIMRGNDEEIFQLLKMARLVKLEREQSGQSDFYTREVERLIYGDLRQQGGERFIKLLIKHGDEEPEARVSAAHALARMGGVEAGVAISRWIADDKPAKRKYRLEYGSRARWDTVSAQTLLKEALDLLEGRKVEATIAEVMERNRVSHEEMIANYIADLNSENENRRKIAEETLFHRGREVVALLQPIAAEAFSPLGPFAQDVLDRIRLAQQVRWLSYLGAGCSTNRGQIIGAQVQLDRHLNRNDAVVVMSFLQQQPGLRRMSLTVDPERFDQLALLAGFTQLESLTLKYGEGVSDEDLAPLRHLTKLQLLDLSLTKISDAGLAHLAGLTRLTNLDLKWTKITDAGLAQLSGLKRLEDLDLAGVKISGAGLVHLEGLPTLKILKLNHSTVSDLRGLKNMPALETLDLYRAPLTDEGLSNISQLKLIRELTLMSPHLTDACLHEIGKMKQLEELSLRQSKITDEGLRSLANLTGLRELNLSETSLTDACLEHLKPFKKLEILAISSTAITDAVFERAREFKSLRSLRVMRTAVTRKAKLQFIKEFPGIAVSTYP